MTNAQTYIQDLLVVDSNACCVLDTRDLNFLSKTYLVFYYDSNQSKIKDLQVRLPSKLFDTLTFTYNSEESVISSDFLEIFVKNHLETTDHDKLEKMYNGSPGYVPVCLGFYYNPLWIKSQQISFSINGPNLSKFKKIQLVYDIINSETDNPKDQIPLELYSMIVVNGYNSNIKLIQQQKYVQTISWIYKDTSQLIHPIKEIKLGSNVETGYNSGTISSDYFRYISQFQTYSSVNPDLYTYSFILNPIDHSNISAKKISNLEIIQKYMSDVDPTSISQHICIREIKIIDLL
jgi:hypothetical protein